MNQQKQTSSPIRLEEPLESEYKKHVMETDGQKTKIYLVIGICVFFAFIIPDWYMVRGQFSGALLTRLATTAIMLGLLLIYLRYSQSYEGRNTLIAIGAFVANLAIIFIALLAFSVGEYSYHYGTVLVLAALFGICNMPFWYSLFAGISMVAVYLFALGTYFYMANVRTSDTTPMHYWLNSVMICVAFTVIGLLAVYRRESYKRALFKLLQEEKRRSEQEKRRADKEQQYSRTDDRTRLYNYKHYEHELREWYAECRQEGRCLTLLFADVDLFKSCNDNYGYGYGNFVLQSIAEVMKDKIMESGCEGFAARHGGDEFVILLKDVSLERAREVAEQIRQGVMQRQLRAGRGNDDSHVTVSIGVVTMVPEHETDYKALHEQATRIMQAAKRQGRNRIVLQPDVAHPSDDRMSDA